MGVIKERYAVCSRYRGSELRDANGKSYNHNKTAELQGSPSASIKPPLIRLQQAGQSRQVRYAIPRHNNMD